MPYKSKSSKIFEQGNTPFGHDGGETSDTPPPASYSRQNPPFASTHPFCAGVAKHQGSYFAGTCNALKAGKAATA